MNRTCSVGNIINRGKNFSGMLDHLMDIVGQWSTREIGDNMDRYISRCIDLILCEDYCKEVIYLNEDDEFKLWIVLDEDNYENNMKISDIIEDYLSFKEIDLDYCFFDEDERDEIENQLSMMNTETRRFGNNGK